MKRAEFLELVKVDFDGARALWFADKAKRARESYLRTRARKEAEIKSLNLKIADIPADVLAAIELDCRQYREARIAAALRRIGEAKLIG